MTLQYRARVLEGAEREQARGIIRNHHYTGTVPSGKSHYIACGTALVVWSIPANKNIARFVLGREGSVWELARLWAPDGHDRNLLTYAIARAVPLLKSMEAPDALVSYADPSVGHEGGVYKAAGWLPHGTSAEGRAYRSNTTGAILPRRAFHSGGKSFTKAEIEGRGFTQIKLPGKQRYVRALTKWARAAAVRSKTAVVK